MTPCGRSSVSMLAAMALLGSCAGIAAAADRERPAITLIVYNYAGVPAETMAAAKATVSRLYADAGVDTSWRDARVSTDATSSSASASFDPRAHRETFTVQVIVRTTFPEHAHAIGYVRGKAPAPETSRVMSGVAYVSLERIMRVARARALRQADVFGYVMAHEIAHLLLPSLAHAHSGLMRENWQDEDFTRMAAGYLRFTAAEESRIRARLSELTTLTASSFGAERANR